VFSGEVFLLEGIGLVDKLLEGEVGEPWPELVLASFGEVRQFGSFFGPTKPGKKTW
jgi:hypothetical protein